MVGVELDMVVPDSLKALELYEKIFDIEEVNATDFPLGENEVMFTLYGTQFHLLDENPEFHLIAPKPGDSKTSWVNVTVTDIEETYKNALDSGCSEVQPVTEIAEMGLSNAMFTDPFGYVWMLHQVHREVSSEEMKDFWEKNRGI